jgi:hypothetical protein
VEVYRGRLHHADGSHSPVERWVLAANGDWVSLDSEKRTSRDIVLEPEGCDCTELCSMGPTCPGGVLAGIPGAGCTRVTSPGAPEAEHDSSLCPEEESRYMECSCPCEQCKHICTAGGES